MRIFLFEHDDASTARAVLQTGSSTLTGHGIAHGSRIDHLVNEIGDEAAVARALTDLAGQLMAASKNDTAAVVVGRALAQAQVE